MYCICTILYIVVYSYTKFMFWYPHRKESKSNQFFLYLASYRVLHSPIL